MCQKHFFPNIIHLSLNLQYQSSIICLWEIRKQLMRIYDTSALFILLLLGGLFQGHPRIYYNGIVEDMIPLSELLSHSVLKTGSNDVILLMHAYWCFVQQYWGSLLCRQLDSLRDGLAFCPGIKNACVIWCQISLFLQSSHKFIKLWHHSNIYVSALKYKLNVCKKQKGTLKCGGNDPD